MTTGKTIAFTIQNFIGKVPFAVPYHSVFTRSEKTICHIWESSWVEGLYESPSVQARTEWCPSLPCLSPAFYSFFHLSKICEHQLTCQTPASSLIRRCAFRNCALAFPEPLPNFQVMSSTQRNWGSLLNPSQLLTQFVESYGICALARLGCPCQAVVSWGCPGQAGVGDLVFPGSWGQGVGRGWPGRVFSDPGFAWLLMLGGHSGVDQLLKF